MESKKFFWFTKKDPKLIIQNIYILQMSIFELI